MEFNIIKLLIEVLRVMKASRKRRQLTYMIEGAHADPVATLVTFVALVVQRHRTHHLADSKFHIPSDTTYNIRDFGSPLRTSESNKRSLQDTIQSNLHMAVLVHLTPSIRSPLSKNIMPSLRYLIILAFY